MALRKIITLFLLCLAASFLLTFLLVHSYFGGSLDSELLQIVFLGALIWTNIIYLCIILYKIDPLLILIIAPIYYFFDLIYTRFSKDLDARLKSLYLLAGLLVATIIVHVIQRKSSPR